VSHTVNNSREFNEELKEYFVSIKFQRVFPHVLFRCAVILGSDV